MIPLLAALKAAFVAGGLFGSPAPSLTQNVQNLIQEKQNPIVNVAVENHDYATLIKTEGLTVGTKQQTKLIKVLEERIKDSQDRIKLGLLGNKELAQIASGSVLTLLGIYSSWVINNLSKDCDYGTEENISSNNVKFAYIAPVILAFMGLNKIHSGLTKKPSKEDYSKAIATLEALKKVKTK